MTPGHSSRQRIRLHQLRLAWAAAAVAVVAPPAARAQAPAPAEVVVVGTVHSETPVYTGDSLRLRSEYRTISMENAAVSRYAERTGTPLRPYDIQGRNQEYQRHDYFNLQRRMSQAIGRLDDQHAFGAEAQGLLRELDDLSAIRDAIGADRPRVINSAASDTAIRHKQQAGSEGLARVLELTAPLAEYRDYWAWSSAFWIRRNEAMRANIVRAAAAHPGGRIVVICGYEHRYYLRTLLRDDDAAGRLKLREYWEY